MRPIKELDHAASRLVSPAFRRGTEAPDFSSYERELRIGRSVDAEPVQLVVEEAMARYTLDQTTEADAWLAPRLHYALRLTRREAARGGIWRWLGCIAMPDYIRWRFGQGNDEGAPPERFHGPTYKQAVARLWWMAELFRDGGDYTPVSAAMMNQDIPNNLFRMDVAHHRPTVQAAVRVLNGRIGREANALAKAINAAASTLAVDLIAPDEAIDTDAVRTWVTRAGDVDPAAYFDTLPPGPEEPRVVEESVARMQSLLDELLAEAPVRGRT
jgi:Family of unknown function (DUF6339)